MLSVRQKINKALYPLIMLFKKSDNKRRKRLANTENKKPAISFFDLKATANNGEEIFMNVYRGKKIMIVNVASRCGYTGQYEELEKLYEKKKDSLILLAFPANDFNNQEPGSNEEIEEFCRSGYRVTFPLFKKQSVLKPCQEEIYRWLTDEKLNGWNNQEPVWNFCKYIIDEQGTLKYFYGPAFSPLSKEVIKELT